MESVETGNRRKERLAYVSPVYTRTGKEGYMSDEQSMLEPVFEETINLLYNKFETWLKQFGYATIGGIDLIKKWYQFLGEDKESNDYGAL